MVALVLTISQVEQRTVNWNPCSPLSTTRNFCTKLHLKFTTDTWILCMYTSEKKFNDLSKFPIWNEFELASELIYKDMLMMMMMT